GNNAASGTASGNSTFEFFDDFGSGSIDATKWTSTGGTWTVVNDTEQNGSLGFVARASTANRQILYSSYSGTDYVLDVYGRQMSGRVWGVGVRDNGQNNLYSFNLYDDLNTTNNLYAYSWINNSTNGATAELGSVAVGTVSPSTWYKLTVRAHGSAFDVYKDDALKVTVTDPALTSGKVALYGEPSTVAEFNNVVVRKYASTEPTASVGAAAAQALASVTLNPSSVVGGNPSQGTVTLGNPAPGGNAVVTLSSANSSVASVPSSVTVLAGNTTATLPITTSAVSNSTIVAITASYSGVNKSSNLTVTPAGGPQGWFDPAWAYRSLVAVANSGGSTLSAFEVHVALDSNFDFTKAKSDGTDVRFTSSDGTTAIPFWVESWNSAQKTASVWVRVPTIGAGGSAVYMYYGNPSASSASSGPNTFEFFDDFSGSSINTSRWTVNGGTWAIAQDVEPSGSTGGVAKGTTTNLQTLYSSFSGTDYVVDAYAKQLSGRVLGLGVRANAGTSFYSLNLYNDLNNANNLYAYMWTKSGGQYSAADLGSVALGTINLSTWYKLSVKIHATSIDVYKNDVFAMHVTDSTFTSGGVALYGEQGTVAEWNNVMVRRYAPTEPNTSACVGATPSVKIVQPLSQYLQTASTLYVNALACLDATQNSGWGVRFLLDGGPGSGGQQVDVHSAPYQGTFTNVSKAEHTIDAYVIDATGTVIAGSGNHDTVVRIGIGDYYVAMGDSITHGDFDTIPGDDVSNDGRNSGGGYEPVLNNLLTSYKGYPQTVVDEAVGGTTSADGLTIVNDLVAKHANAQRFLVDYGMNDARPWLPVPSGQGLSPGDAGYAGSFKDHMQQIINAIRAGGKSVALSKINIALADCNDPANCSAYPNPDTGARSVLIKQYNQVIDELRSIAANNITVVPPDLYTYFAAHYTTEYYDYIHPNGIGYQSMANLWFNALK
ncbi:MAG TPA: DUF2341 domain-containing protein, partial [Phycisphaerae bacterium]